jgi:hypothetical protein
LPKEKTKVCIGCFYTLPLSKFNKHEEGQYGKRARCKKCFASFRKGGNERVAYRKALLKRGLRPCSGCNKEKPVSNFSAKVQANGKKGWEGRCRPCSNAQKALQRFDLRTYVFEYLKKHPCVDCGETNVLALEFDHIHSKKFDIGTALVANISIDLVEKEIKKCVVRCSTCHRIKTHLEINSWRFQMSLQDKATSTKIKRTKQYKALMKVG